MSETPVDRERRFQRVTYALIHGSATADTEVLIAKDDESISQALALEVIAPTSPAQLGNRLPEIQDALMDRRWADALVAWMDATGRTVDACRLFAFEGGVRSARVRG